MNHRKRKTLAGAYYTPPDVADFIARGALLPWLLDAAAEAAPSAFRANGPAWRLLRQQPLRYLFPELPQRAALPTETPLETQARRRRCQGLVAQLRAGAIASVNALVTHHLDVRRFVLDLLVEPTLAEVRAAFADSVERVTILDPTCGDGAILWAAQQILREIRQACGALGQPTKSNLYGVDVRDEAVAECRRTLAQAGSESTNIVVGDALTAECWRHAFPAVSQAGGFDVIIGNPPYLAADRDAAPPELRTADCPDIYAWVLERAVGLLKSGGRAGMIVPLSLAFSRSFETCRRLLFESYASNWFSAYGRIPSALFDFDIRVRNVIHFGQKDHGEVRNAGQAMTTRLHRWYDEARPQLFPLLHYVPFRPECWQGRVPLLPSPALAEAMEQRRAATTVCLADCLAAAPTPHALWYKKTAYNWLTFCRVLPPCYDADGLPVPQSQFDVLYFATAWQRDLAFLLLNGKLAFAYWTVVGDDFHVARWMFGGFPIDLPAIPPAVRRALLPLVPRLERAMRRATAFKRNAGKRVGTYNLARCRAVTDQSDLVFSAWLGWQDLWPEVELVTARQVKTEFEALAEPGN
ncbi:MAG: N-6 DNA methylase [Planctomycetia bacterium]|nr:N-6 DNA methylase [Planctomycetia bacterium]